MVNVSASTFSGWKKVGGYDLGGGFILDFFCVWCTKIVCLVNKHRISAKAKRSIPFYSPPKNPEKTEYKTVFILQLPNIQTACNNSQHFPKNLMTIARPELL